MITLNSDWLNDHPLPAIDHGTDKNRRGRLLIAGGSQDVPGALLLTGEAGYRAGAGKVQLAVPQSTTCAVGVLMPEAAVFGLVTNDKGELGPDIERLIKLMERCDAFVFGPGMGADSDALPMLEAILADGDKQVALLLDAAAIAVCPDVAEAAQAWQAPLVLTPHPGEMAALMRCEADAVEDKMAQDAADRFGATVLLKGPHTLIASPGESEVLQYEGPGPGMATGGSGDVLAGIIGGLLARGADARTGAAWGVWAHGEAGRRLAQTVAPIGFLARELLSQVPGLLYRRSADS